MQKLKLSNDWFATQTQPLWEKHLLPRKDRINRYLELGVCEGASMCWVLENLEPAHAIGVDWYQPKRRQESTDRQRENAQHNLKPWIDSRRLMMIESDTYELFTQRDPWLAKSREDRNSEGIFDLAFVDAGHKAWEAIADMIHVWPKLRPAKFSRPSGRGEMVEEGGIMVVDDLHRRYQQGPQVLPAMQAFLLAYDTRFSLLYWEARQAAFIKLK